MEAGETMETLGGKTLFITGGSRGIGLAIALRAARDGANVAIAAKTAEPHPKLPGTIHTAAEEIEKAGGKGLPILCAINLSKTPETDMKRFDLMHQINARGTYLASKLCIPHLAKSANPHILMLSPPLDMKAKWFAPHLAYSLAKFGMSICVLGLAQELKGQGIAVNALWPRTTIATAAVNNLLGGDRIMRASRKPEIMADAAHLILTRPAREFTGNFCLDDTLLAEHGVTDFEHYRVDPSVDLMQDFFVPDDSPAPVSLKATA
jgi:citronellol/citronellal dehydrogenase